jgi:hypothetical protein
MVIVSIKISQESLMGEYLEGMTGEVLHGNGNLIFRIKWKTSGGNGSICNF